MPGCALVTGDDFLFAVLIVGVVAYTATILVQLGYELWNARRTDDDELLMECPRCKEIAYGKVGNHWNIMLQREIDEYECTECGQYGIF